MDYLIGFTVGFIFCALLVLIFSWLRRKDTNSIVKEVISQTESQKNQDLEVIISRLKDSFGALSSQALSKNIDDFLKLANETLSKQTQMGEKELDGKKKLIEQSLEGMRGALHKVQEHVTNFEKDREQKFGELSKQLKLTAEQTGKLQETTGKLQTALASTKARGQWGERMAEDVLRLAGFIEGINYQRQKTQETVGTRPDFTFPLPNGLKINMDVKFPLDNYLQFVEEDGEVDKQKHKDQFLRDVKGRIKEVTNRDYINPQEKTVDYVILFIPNEQVYSFIHENDRTLLDDALRNKVILCSPLTLYAILAVIKQAVESFSLEEKAGEILRLFGAFNKQWTFFINSFEKMGRRIEEAQKEFNALNTTRRNQLDRQLLKIEDLRKQKGLSDGSKDEEK